MVKKADYIIMREDVRANPETLFLFGDNTQRTGYGGQAKEMRGEPNTHGICIKRYPNNEPYAFMSDVYFTKNMVIISSDINAAIAKYKAGGYTDVIIPPLGVGLAKLPEKAPKTYAFLLQELERLTEELKEYKGGVMTTDEFYGQPGDQTDFA